MAISEKGVKPAKKIMRQRKLKELIDKFDRTPDPDFFLPKKPKGPKRLPFKKVPRDLLERGPFKPVPRDKELLEKLKKQRDQRKSGPAVDKSKKKKNPQKKFADGGKAESFGMLSVKAGVDNNPNPTQADRIVGATKKKNGGPVDSPKKKDKKKKMPGLLAIGIEIIKPKKPIKAARGGLAGRLAKRGYGKARS